VIRRGVQTPSTIKRLRKEKHMELYVNPFRQLRSEMDRLLGSFMGPAFDGMRGQPAVNVWDDGDVLMAEMELPGVKAEQIDVSVERDQLTIKVERPEVAEEDITYHRRERPTGSFSRVLTLPCEINSEGVEADLKNGVLTLRLPKAEAAKPRKINVTSA
jgi:HSP20 family protein